MAEKPQLVICSQGSLELFSDNDIISLGAGEFCFEDTVLLNTKDSNFDMRARENSEIYKLPYTSVWYLPCLHWALMETFQKRCQRLGVNGKLSKLKIGA